MISNALGKETAMLKRLLATTAVLFALATGGAAGAAQHGTDRPFHADGTGAVSFDFGNPRDCPVSPLFGLPVTELIAGGGRATHLGHYELAATHCPLGSQSADGWMTLTAANGDVLRGTYTNDLAYGPGTVDVTGWLEITGGTGRFTDASGSIWQHHVVHLDTLTVQFDFDGTLSY
jgi:hypothetical protein